MPKQRRVRLKVGSAPYVVVRPRWDSDQTEFTTEQGQDEMYFREKLDIKLTFQRGDFDLIFSAPIETVFVVSLEEFTGGAWLPINVLRFWKTDCEPDIDNKTLVVTPQTFDSYEKILEGMSKEFNLIELEPPTVSVNYKKNGIYQVYLPSSEFIANYMDGLQWETPTAPFSTTPAPGEVGTNDNHNSMLDKYGFGVGKNTIGAFNYSFVVIPDTGLTPDVSGIYEARFYNGDGLPIAPDFPLIAFRQVGGDLAIIVSGLTSPGTTQKQIVRLDSSDSILETIMETPLVATPSSMFGHPPHSSPNETFFGIADPAQECKAYQFLPYVRLLTDEREVLGNPTQGIDTLGIWSSGTTYQLSDVVTYNGQNYRCKVSSSTNLPTDTSDWSSYQIDPFPHGNYKRALPIETLNFEFSGITSTTPTRWGKVPADPATPSSGQYFVKPTSTETLMPLLSSTWSGASAWFWLDADLLDLQEAAGKDIVLKDCYKFSDVIGKLLLAVGSTAEHRDNPTFSNFLYATSNAIRGARRVPVIVPKSNVLIGNYDQPAKKAPIRLREVLDFARDFWNAYWHLSGRNFIIEHRHFYDNGKSYTSPGIGIDLTTAKEPRTGKPWSYRTSKFTYDKDRLPERFEFKWGDNVSKPFEGYPIQVNSTYVNKGDIKQKPLSKFTSDIDFFNVAANDISKEGFVVLECIEDGTELNVPFVEVTVSTDETYKLQNGYMAFIYAHPQYWKHGLPAKSVNLNGQDITATTTIRTIKQPLEMAVGATIDPYLLITSSLGNGKVETVKRNLSSNSHTITLKLETI